METIQRKIEGQDITADKPVTTGGDKIIDLMEALKASLASAGDEEEEEEAPKKKKARKAS
jgi:non-homologous end joining protein Ku